MDDVNELIYLANQMGILDGLIHMPNASKCISRIAVEETNISQYKRRVLEIEDIYGMFFILTIGLGGALLIFVAECTLFKLYSKKGPVEGERN